MEGLQMGVMTETQTSIIAPNASLPANPLHANQTPGSHGGADSRCRTDHEVENSAITPSPTIAGSRSHERSWRSQAVAAVYRGDGGWPDRPCVDAARGAPVPRAAVAPAPDSLSNGAA